MTGAVTAQAPRAGAHERARMLELFVRLCEIESESRRERAVADAVRAELGPLGIEVEEDASASQTGSNSGNLIARIPGPEGARTIMLCAHLDTVPLDAPVEVVREDEFFANRNEAILGADNKAAIATMLAAVRHLIGAGGAPVGLELVFTTCEELTLLGALALDRGSLRSEFGFVFDHASPVGELIVASPTYFSVIADFHGRAAHAGIRPEDGHNAIAAAAAAFERIEIGRLDPESTANAGRIEGGTAANVVAERCRLELEARSIDAARAADIAHGMVDALTAAASEHQCDVETMVEERFRGFRLARSEPAVLAAASALEALAIEPEYVASGGGSDANAFIPAGLPCLNVANGTERNHQPDERVAVGALEATLDLTLGIVAASAAG